MGGHQFGIEESEFGSVRRLSFEGELDLAATGRADAAIHDAVEASPCVELDLRKLTFMDSSGLRTILKGCELSRTSGKFLTIFPGPKAVQRVFELTGLVEVLPFVTPVDPDD